jgi:hypothetical protein
VGYPEKNGQGRRPCPFSGNLNGTPASTRRKSIHYRIGDCVLFALGPVFPFHRVQARNFPQKIGRVFSAVTAGKKAGFEVVAG